MHFTKRLEKTLIFEIALFCAGITMIFLFYYRNTLLTLLLAIAWTIGLVFWHEKHDVLFFVVAAIVGPLAEIVCVHFGVWSYKNPSFLGIPMWLPLAWGLSIMVIKRIAVTFVKIEMK